MATPSVPLLVGRYVLHDQLGTGGMATVHYGRLVGSAGFSRTVAIKQLHPHLAREPELAAMFLDEARLAARVRHPNVVSTLDVVAEHGALSLVLEYVHGESLARLVRQAGERGAPPPPSVAAAIVAGVLHGLHAAHEARSETGQPLGIVHRDISPQNVIVGADGVARVLDFGVAKAIGRVQTTREGQAKGKLAYMAPEQLTTGAVDRRTDVYAAAIVLWETLTGERLFRATSEGVLYGLVMRGGAPPPSTLAPGISPSLDAIVARGLAREPSERFQSAREMAVAIEATGQVATTSVVADWVEDLAHDALRERAQRIAEIESGAEAAADESAVAAHEPVSDHATMTSVRTAPLAGRGTNEAAATRHRKRWALGAGAAFFLCAVVVYANVQRGAAPPVVALPALASAPPVALGDAAPEQTHPAEGPRFAPAAAVSVAADKPDAKPPSTSIRRDRRAPTKGECEPPVWIDAAGFKHYKPQCVR